MKVALTTVGDDDPPCLWDSEKKNIPTLSTYIHSLFRTYAISSPNNFYLLPVGSVNVEATVIKGRT